MKLSFVFFCNKPSKAAVWISRSQCIFENLAFEDWLFRNIDFVNLDGLLIWRNRPAVVIGKHQNSFVECDVQYAKRHDIDVARRSSGGGTVYHDLGNVNFSFFTSRIRHNRPTNLRLLQTVLKKRFEIPAELTPRHDLLLFGSKISGTAAKLAGKNSYHHLTLLIDYNANHMKNVLRSSFNDLETTGDVQVISKATQSVRACKVGSLKQFQSSLHFVAVVEAVLQEFSNRYNEMDEIVVDAFDEDNYIGYETTLSELKSWDWIFGLNPPFTVLKNPSPVASVEETAAIDVEKGLIKKVVYNCSAQLISSPSQQLQLGTRFSPSLCYVSCDKENKIEKQSIA